MSTVAYPHIDIAPDGTAYIAGTGFKVRMLVEEHLASQIDAVELQRRHPHLTIAQVYGTLVYYHDHKPEFDAQIADLVRSEAELQPRLEVPSTTEKLRQTMSRRKARG